MDLSSSVQDLKGVGEVIAKHLASQSIYTISDLIDYYPRTYEDFSDITTISRLRPGNVTLKCEIKQIKGRYVRRGMHITEAVASDNTGSIKLVWFNQPYREASIKKDTAYYIAGDFQLNAGKLSIINPAMEPVSSFPINSARIVPIYRQTKFVKSLDIRKLIKQVIPTVEQIEETLPAWVIADNKLLSLNEALRFIHFPPNKKLLESARHRLGFEEVFRLGLASLLNKYELKLEQSIKIPFKADLAKSFVDNLPFKLTDSQRRVVWQIYQDMEKTQPMNRLIQGDVGSGKTVVAAMASLMAMEQGFQVAFMAPTELLAKQHAETIHKMLHPLGYSDQVSLLVGSMKPTQKKAAHDQIKKGKIRLIVGTHALISEKVNMHKLGLVVIDEQHRFGVDQRKSLLAKAGHAPHVLTLSATPIPRSIALTLYGELDISVIDMLPIGRKPVITKIVSPNSRANMLNRIKLELKAGRQVFIVCPQITETELSDAKAAEVVYEQTIKDYSEYKVGLLHGKLKALDKDSIMKKFIDNKLNILVSTTVVEVGVDVPNASIMVIEDAERFGLAQIHQLRGRVGRSNQQGYCFLAMPSSKPPSQRLRALESSNDGFELAELDLKIRGPGSIYGTSQHGVLDLRIANFTDTKLISAARNSAQKFIDREESLLKYKQLNSQVTKLRAVTNLN